MPARYLEDVAKPGQTVNPLFAFLGVEFKEAGREKARLELPFRPEFIQGGGVAAGGILATLADEAMAHVVMANLEQGQRTATIEMSVRYFRPVLKGIMVAEAVVVNRGRRIMGVEAQVADGEGRLLAKASASFMVL